MATKQPSPFIGRWRIVEMEQWDRDYIDIEVPGYIKFDKGDLGSFQFGTVQGEIDWRVETYGDSSRVEFSWEGENDDEPGCGRGWAELRDGGLYGRLYMHKGDDSWFKASKK